MTLNILVLHNVEDVWASRRSTIEHIVAFERYAPDHRYVYYPIVWPVTDAIREFGWDAVILTSTALGVVTFRPRDLFERMRTAWSFLSDHGAVKLAFPQDDADHGACLDDWFAKLRVDHVFSVRPERKEFIYPKTSQIAEFHATYAGYLDDATVARMRSFTKSFDERTVTIGQRVTMYEPHGGRLARLKGEAALVVKAAAIARGVSEEISTDPKKTLFGDAWYRFLGDCRFVVGAEGGLGVWDPRGEVLDCCRAYMAAHPEAKFEDVERVCFPGLDGNPEFPGFSPRILEAAAMECCQILVEGEYRGILAPMTHYIPLKRDFSNVPEVFRLLKDRDLVLGMIERCRTDLVESPTFRYATLVGRVIELLDRRGGKPSDHHSPPTRSSAIEALRQEQHDQGFRTSALAERIGSMAGRQTIEMYVSDRDHDESVKALAAGAAALQSLALDVAVAHEQSPSYPLSARASNQLQGSVTLAAALAEFAADLTLALGREGRLDKYAQGATAKIVSVASDARSLGEALHDADLSLPERLVQLLREGGRRAEILSALACDAPEEVWTALDPLAPPSTATGSWTANDRARATHAEALLRSAPPGSELGRLTLALGADGKTAGRRAAHAEALLRSAPPESELGRLTLALGGEGKTAAGLVNRLTPASGETFSEEEIKRVALLDRLLVLSEGDPDALAFLARIQGATKTLGKRLIAAARLLRLRGSS